MAFSFRLPGRLQLPAWMRGPAVRRPTWGWLTPKYPPVAFELDTRSLSMVRIGKRKQERYLASFDFEEVPPDLIEIDFMKARLASPERYRDIVAKLIAKDPVKFRTASIVLPDNYARVSILPFESIPRSRRDTLDLIRYRTKKAVPFKVEDAALDYQILRGPGGQISALTVMTPRSVIEEFESVFGSVGIQVGLVELSTFSLLNVYQSVLAKELDPSSEFLIANVCGTYFTFAIFRGGGLVFFRCKGFAAGIDDDGGEGSLRLLKRELQTSLLYYRDKVEGKGLACAYLRVTGLDRAAVCEIFSSATDVARVAMIDPSRVISVDGRVSGEHGDQTLQRLLPAIGAAAGRTAS